MPLAKGELTMRENSGVAELWCGSTFLGLLREEQGGIVLRLESHASGPVTVNAVALERALAAARETLVPEHIHSNGASS
jgi:hypothetical protein